MTFFRNYDKAQIIRDQNAEFDPDWQYILHAVPVRNGTRQAWIIEIRDEDGILLGCI